MDIHSMDAQLLLYLSNSQNVSITEYMIPTDQSKLIQNEMDP